MDVMIPSTNLAAKSADISQWFDDLVSTIRVEQIQLESGIAIKEKQDFWRPFLENNSLEIAVKSREMSSRLIIPELIGHYLSGLKERNVILNSLSLQLSDSKILVWAIVNDDDEKAMDQLFLQEAVVNAKYGDYGFHISTTVMEKSDGCATPPQFHSVY